MDALTVINKIVFTLPEVMVEFSQGKIKTSVLLKNPFNILCKFILIWKVNRTLWLQISINSCYAKNVIRNADYGARKLCLLPKSWWNFNVGKIIRILYSLFSTKYITFLYHGSTWFEASTEDLKSNYVIHGMWRESCHKHTIYCATELVFPYDFSFVFGIAWSRTVWVTVIFMAWFLFFYNYLLLNGITNLFFCRFSLTLWTS